MILTVFDNGFYGELVLGLSLVILIWMGIGVILFFTSCVIVKKCSVKNSQKYPALKEVETADDSHIVYWTRVLPKATNDEELKVIYAIAKRYLLIMELKMKQKI